MSRNKATPQEFRRRARRRALQALYQWQVTAQVESADFLVHQFVEHQDFSEVDEEYFSLLLHGVVDEVAAIDERLSEFLDRPLDEIDQIERAILRLGCFELMKSNEVPALVVLDEAIELAHHFGAEQGHSYINGVLDKAAKSLRSSEFAQG